MRIHFQYTFHSQAKIGNPKQFYTTYERPFQTNTCKTKEIEGVVGWSILLLKYASYSERNEGHANSIEL